MLGNVGGRAAIFTAQRKPLQQILRELESRVGRRFFGRVNFRLAEEKKQKLRKVLSTRPPKSFAGTEVVRADTRDGFKFHLRDGSWFLIRFSGTEPIVRFYWEARDKARYDALAREGKKFIGSL